MEKINTNQTYEKTLEDIKLKIELLKKRLDNIDRILTIQEEVLDLISENTKSLCIEAQESTKNFDLYEKVIRQSFTKGKIPRILYK